MVTGNERASSGGARRHINSLRPAAIGAAAALALLTAAASPAAAASQDATSNTIQFSVASAVPAGAGIAHPTGTTAVGTSLMENDGIWLPGA